MNSFGVTRKVERAPYQVALQLAVGTLCLFAGAAVSLLRVRGAGPLDTLWAEDGAIFLQDALRDPGPATWFHGYAGYMHLVPRWLGSLAALLPIGWAPAVLSAGAAAATAAIALVTYQATREHIPARGVRLALGLSVILLAPAGLEVVDSAANIHWYLLFGGVLAALWEPTSRAGWAAGSALLFLAAASDPFAVFLAPIVGVRWLRRRRVQTAVLCAALGAGLLLQTGAMLASRGTRELDPLRTRLVDLARWYGFHVLETAAFGVRLRDALAAHLGLVATAVLAVAVLGALLAPALRAARKRPGVPLALGWAHAIYFAAPALLAGLSSSRYTIAPILLLYVLIGWGVAQAGPRAARPLGALALGLLALTSVLDFAPESRRTTGPRWSQALATARGGCANDPTRPETLVVPPLQTIPPPDPTHANRVWSVEVPCPMLAAGGTR